MVKHGETLIVIVLLTNICNHGNNSFYLDEGDSNFTKVTSRLFVNNNDNSDGCCWADFNNDNYLDLLVTIHGLNYLCCNNCDSTVKKNSTVLRQPTFKKHSN